MSTPDAALATQLTNIEKRTGKSLAELKRIVRESPLTRHGELRAMLQQELGMGYGDANTLVHVALKPDDQGAAGAAPASPDDVVTAIYAGPKAALRPIHDEIMARIHALGDFEIAPKKTYLSLRRKKQFAMVGPATKTMVEVGLNAKGLPASERLVEVPAGGMCNYKVRVGDVREVDAELLGWVRQAYDGAG